MTAARGFVAWGDFVPPTCRLHYGGILIAVGRWEEAEEELLAAARMFEGGLRAMRAAPLMKLAALRVRQGRFEEAERLLEGNESRPEARQALAAIALARGDLALAEDLARLCLEREDASDPACAPLLELLADVQLGRETEVLSLLATGCSNAEIAERLYISKRTAEHHVASILSKLELRSRAEAAAYAVASGPKHP